MIFLDSDNPILGFVMLAAIGAIIYFIRLGKQKNLTANETASGIDSKRKISVGTYVGGHPNINNSQPTDLYLYNDSIKIATEGKVLAEIGSTDVKNITIEDDTQVRHRIGLKRMVLLGPLSLAVKKKVVEQHSFLTIEWNDGRFDHDTIFRFDGKGAMQSANWARNQIIKVIK